MKRINAVLFYLVALLAAGCYSVRIVSPATSQVVLATAQEPLPVRQRVTNWYVLFGAVPLNAGRTTDVIASLKLEKVRIQTKISPTNILLNGLLNVLLPTTVVTTTTIIEGDIKRQSESKDTTNQKID